MCTDEQIATNRAKFAAEFLAHYWISCEDYRTLPAEDQKEIRNSTRRRYFKAHPKPKAAPRPKLTPAERIAKTVKSTEEKKAAKAATNRKYRLAHREETNRRQNATRAADKIVLASGNPQLFHRINS